MLTRALIFASCLGLAGPALAATGATDTGAAAGDTGTTGDTGAAAGDTGTTGDSGTTAETGTTGDSGTTADSGSTSTEDGIGAAEKALESGGFGCNNANVELATGLALLALWLVVTRRRDGEDEREPVRITLRRK